jgi:hypothetical protein
VKLCKIWTSKGEIKNLSQIFCFLRDIANSFEKKLLWEMCPYFITQVSSFGAIFGSVFYIFSSFNLLIDAKACLA